MAVPTGGPYYILLAGRGTGQTATLEYGSKPTNVGFAGESTTILGPYDSLASAEAKLKVLTNTGTITVVNAQSQAVLGSVNVAAGTTSDQPGTAGSSQPTNPAGDIQAQGGTEGSLPNLNPFSSIENALSAFYDKVTDGKMWRSLGWIVLGIILIGIGMFMLIGEKVVNVASKLPIIPV